MSHPRPIPAEPHTVPRASRDRCAAFLDSRLTEELAELWDRDTSHSGSPTRPGLAAQVVVLDDLLRALTRGDLPAGADLRILLFAYGRHPDYDPTWTDLVGDPATPARRSST